jgi:S1-C subfamily serine protease
MSFLRFLRLILCALALAACVQGQAFALSWQEIVARSSGAIVHLEGLSADGQNRITGTGFFITSDGVLITNRHIVESVRDGSLVAYNIFGERLGSAMLEADTVGTVDLAVMKVVVKKPVVYLSPHKWGSAHAGDSVVILGFPGNQLTISKGSVGGFTDVDGLPVVELRADVTHGSSGSPVLDADGKVLGVVTGTITGPNPIGQKIEVNYAEPIELARDMISAVLDKIHPEGKHG